MKMFTYFVVFTFMIVSKSFAQSFPANSPNSVIEKAEQGEPHAQYNLGVCYENGEGTKKDLKRSILWYRKAAGQGLVEAKEQLKRLQK